MATIAETLAIAIRHHQAGRRQAAVQIYQQILAVDPDQPDAIHLLGVTAHEAGEHYVAIEHIRRAIQLNGKVGAFHNNLGNAYQGLGMLDEAVACYRRALELKPDYAHAHNNLGTVLEKQEKWDEAAACYRRALELKPDYADAFNNLGAAFRAKRQLNEAVACYRWALELKPDYADAHNNLGNAFKDLGNIEEAVAAFRRALALRPDFADAHNNLGIVLRHQNKLDEAAACFRRALELKSNFAEAMFNLGDLHQDRGEMGEAELALRAGLKIQPTSALAHACLATLLRGKLPESDRIALEERVLDSQLTQDLRCQLAFALALVLDGRGEYRRAADILRQANALRLEIDRGDRAYLPPEHERFVDNLITGFNRDFFARESCGGVDTRVPVFIVGLPRSGTTLIEQVLASHSCIHGAGELQLGRLSFDAIAAAIGCYAQPIDCVPLLNSTAIASLAKQHLQRLSDLESGRADRIVDKMTDNYLYLGLLAAMFPRATFIHCRRDLRDVAVSCWLNDLRKIRWTYDPEHLASRFQQYRRIMDHWRRVLPVAIHQIDYEAAVADLEPVARSLVAACGLDWEPACLEFHRTQRPVRTASRSQVREPIYAQSVARWRNYEHELAGLFAALPRE